MANENLFKESENLTMEESSSSWWPSFKWVSATKKSCLQAEKNLLDQFVGNEYFDIRQHDVNINYDATPISMKNKQLQSSSSFPIWSSNNNNNNYNENKKTEMIHTVTISPRLSKLVPNKSLSIKPIPPIVLNHGYGCAGGIFIPAIFSLCQQLIDYLNSDSDNQFKVNNHNNDDVKSDLNSTSPIVIHIIDWLGCGLSSKPKFQCSDVDETEDFFAESLEAWRQAMGIKKFILAGHSLGGYMSCVYAMKYPQYIDHLILISPAGLPRKPQVWGDMSNAPFKQRLFYSTFRYCWDKNITPHDIVRYIGPGGPKLVKKLIEKRLGLDEQDPLQPLLADYLYHTLHDNGSGEYALNKILEFGVWARKPLYKRISILKKYQKNVSAYYDDDIKSTARHNGNRVGFQVDNENSDSEIDTALALEDFGEDVSQINSNLKIDFIYGAMDWMQPSNAHKIKRKGKIKCNVYIVRNSGHQLILENPEDFAKTLANIIIQGQFQNDIDQN